MIYSIPTVEWNAERQRKFNSASYHQTGDALEKTRQQSSYPNGVAVIATAADPYLGLNLQWIPVRVGAGDNV
jgi:hypothetical protein